MKSGHIDSKDQETILQAKLVNEKVKKVIMIRVIMT